MTLVCGFREGGHRPARRCRWVDKYGMIFAASAPEATLTDACSAARNAHLAELKRESCIITTRVLTRKLNWKIVVDTSSRPPLQYLHTIRSRRSCNSNTTTFDAFGQACAWSRREHHRQLRAIRSRNERHPADRRQSTCCFRTPCSSCMAITRDLHVYPSGDGVNESTMRVSFTRPSRRSRRRQGNTGTRNFNLLRRRSRMRTSRLRRASSAVPFAGAGSDSSAATTGVAALPQSVKRALACSE